MKDTTRIIFAVDEPRRAKLERIAQAQMLPMSAVLRGMIDDADEPGQFAQIFGAPSPTTPDEPDVQLA